MQYTGKNLQSPDIVSLREPLEEILGGLGFNLVEITVSRHKGSVQVRLVIYNGKSIGTDDCTKAHRAVTPRLELAFSGQDVYMEVSSPGIDRTIKDGAEFAHYIGRRVRCYRTDITEWTAGILEAADEKGIVLRTVTETVRLEFDIIAKAKLDSSRETQDPLIKKQAAPAAFKGG
ncbi:MAG: ribosome assembly cofactor RimP [Treponema sp.]|nr:ribosome assembly cofactor RimP [Treponema sp.]